MELHFVAPQFHPAWKGCLQIAALRVRELGELQTVSFR
jgi:hypothetical protein